MMKDIKEYLHFYLGCDVKVKRKNDKTYSIGRVCEVTKDSNHGDWIDVRFDEVISVTSMNWDVSSSNFHTFFFNYDEIKPILRPLSSMTEEEQIFVCHLSMPAGWIGVKLFEATDDDWAMRIRMPNDSTDGSRSLYVSKKKFTPELTRYLLSKHFDLFGLIESGLAIDKGITNEH